MKIQEIYDRYDIMPNLREHQLRVTAVVLYICSHFPEKLSDQKELIAASLLHDMGNIIKFDLDLGIILLTSEEIQYWKKIQQHYIDTYGKDEHKASTLIVKELGVSPRVVELVGEQNFTHLCEYVAMKDLALVTLFYADCRVAPFGITTITERQENFKKRYEGRKDYFAAVHQEERKKYLACLAELEKRILAYANISENDISEESIAPFIKELQTWDIELAS